MQQTERSISAGNMAGLVKSQEEDHEVAFAYDTSHFKDLTDRSVRLTKLSMSLKVFLLEF
jgi:hypothetical protein